MVSTLAATDAARLASPPAMTLSEFGSWFAGLPRPDPEFWDDLAESIENQADGAARSFPQIPGLKFIRCEQG